MMQSEEFSCLGWGLTYSVAEGHIAHAVLHRQRTCLELFPNGAVTLLCGRLGNCTHLFGKRQVRIT